MTPAAGISADLDGLLAPLGRAAFLDSYWGRRSLVLPRDDDRFRGLIDSTGLPALLSGLRPRVPEQMMVVKGSSHYPVAWLNTDGSVRLDRIRAAWREGYSIVLNNFGAVWQPVAGLCASLFEQLHHRVDANLYLTPPHSQAFHPHYDVMDVFVLQVEGSKTWEVREAAVQDPAPDQHRAVDPANLPPVVWQGELTPGSVLYIPRGHVHTAAATASLSLHLTIGVHVVSWLDLFEAAVLASRADPQFRGRLPPGFFDADASLAAQAERLAAVLAPRLSVEAGLAGLAHRLLAQQYPLPGPLFEPEPELLAEMRLRRRPGVLCHVARAVGGAVLNYSGGALAGPPKLEAALRHVAAHRTWSPSELPGSLSASERLVLARRLLREGVVERVSAC